MRGVAAALLIALIAGSAALAWFLVQQAVGGSRYVDWAPDPVVWLGELGLATASILLAIVAIVVAARKESTFGDADAFGWLSSGFLAVGALSLAGGWLGLHVPTTTGYDVLSRGEPLFLLGGAIVAGFGLVLAMVALATFALQPHRSGSEVDGDGVRRSSTA